MVRMDKILDQQGFEIKEGNAYQFIFAMPGPDVTLLKILDIKNENDILAHDLYFGFDITVKATDLFRPIKGGWGKQDAEKIINANASFGGVHLK